MKLPIVTVFKTPAPQNAKGQSPCRGLALLADSLLENNPIYALRVRMIYPAGNVKLEGRIDLA